MKNGPELWDLLHSQVRPIFGDDAVVAGGAIRDYTLGLAPKDIDIFVNCDSEVQLRRSIDRLNHLGGTIYTSFAMSVIEFAGQSKTMLEYEQWTKGELLGCAEGLFTTYYRDMIEQEFDINIVARKVDAPYYADRRDEAPFDWHKSLIERFDMGVVQCYYRGNSEINMTYACLADLSARTATLMRPDTRDLSAKRFERFNARNPGVLRMVDIKEVEDTFA